jgi:hypothetical protein
MGALMDGFPRYAGKTIHQLKMDNAIGASQIRKLYKSQKISMAVAICTCLSRGNFSD